MGIRRSCLRSPRSWNKSSTMALGHIFSMFVFVTALLAAASGFASTEFSPWIPNIFFPNDCCVQKCESGLCDFVSDGGYRNAAVSYEVCVGACYAECAWCLGASPCNRLQDAF